MKSSSFQVGFKLILATSALSSILSLLLLPNGGNALVASKTTGRLSMSTDDTESIKSFESAKTNAMVSESTPQPPPTTTRRPTTTTTSKSLARKSHRQQQRQQQPEVPEYQALESNIANAKVQVNPQDMQVAAGHHHGKSHGKYYMYAESPKKGAYKMGFKRGNHKHMIMRKESLHGSHFHSYFKWHDKKGKGSHKWEYKHGDKKKHGHHYG